MTIANDNENYENSIEKFFGITLFKNEHINSIRNLEDLGIYAYVKSASLKRPISGHDVAEHFKIPITQAYEALDRLMELGVIEGRK